MNDIWNFILSLGEGLQDVLTGVNLVTVLLIGFLIGIVQQKNEGFGLKALAAVLATYALGIFLPRLTGERMVLPDFRHLSAIVQVLLMYIIAFGTIGATGTMKTAMKFQAKKA